MAVNFTWNNVPEVIKISAILLAGRLECDQCCSPWNRFSAFCCKLLERSPDKSLAVSLDTLSVIANEFKDNSFVPE